MKYLLGIDFGGGASKATLINEKGDIVCENTVEYPTLYPSAGACEQDSADWIRALCLNCRAILAKSSVLPSEILAVALDSATHTFLCCDENFVPLRPAIHWTDSRSHKEAAELTELCGEEIFRKTFHKPATIWTLPQIAWLRRAEPELFAKTRHVFFEKDYIRYFLTGVYGTDFIEAEGSMLFHCNTMTWDKELCALVGLDESVLPPLCRPTDVVGSVTPAAASETGLTAGTPVICGTTDTVMEVFASGAIHEGDVTLKLATAGRICVITNQPYPDQNLVNYSHIIDGLWYPGTATKSCAASYRWYRDTFGGDYRELDEAAAALPIGSEGLIFLPHLNGELTPYADPMLCGSFTGVRSHHTKAHFTRAVLEGVAYSLLDCKEYLARLGISCEGGATAIGGGTKGPLWRQMISDALGLRLKTTVSSDSSLGSAMLAGMAAGVFADAEQAVSLCVKEKEWTEPNFDNTPLYRRGYETYKQIHDALAPIYRGEK